MTSLEGIYVVSGSSWRDPEPNHHDKLRQRRGNVPLHGGGIDTNSWDTDKIYRGGNKEHFMTVDEMSNGIPITMG